MFEGLKNQFGYKIGADIPQPISVGESPFKSQQPQEAPVPAMQSTIPEPTPIGEPTATPRFAGLLNSLQPKFQNTSMQSATAEKETPGVYKDTAGNMVNGVLVDQTPLINISEPQPSFIERVTNPNLSIVKPEEITSGLAQLKQHLEQQQEIEQQQTTNPIMKVANYAKSTAGIGIVNALQGLDYGINQMSEGLGGVLGGNPTVGDFGNLILGGGMTALGVAFPGATAGFGIASQAPITKQLLEGFSNLGQKQMINVTNYIPGINQIPEEQRSQFFDFAKYAVAALVLHMGIKKMTPTGKAIVPTEGGIEPVKYQEASKTLDWKEGQDLNQAYKEKSMQTHPDRPGGSTEAQQKVNEAYTYLKDQGFKEAWQDMPDTQKTAVGNTLKAMREKAKAYVGENQFGLSVKSVEGKYVDAMGKEVELPKTDAEYQAFNEKLANGEVKLEKAPQTPTSEPSEVVAQKEKQETLPVPQYANAMEAIKSPEYQAKMKAIKEQQKAGRVTKTSNNLYHTTPKANLESIAKEGLVTGRPARFEGVSSPTGISFSANEEGANYFGGNEDVMIRTKTSFKPKDLEHDLLAGGEGTYITRTNIAPENLEVKVGKKRIPLKEYVKENNIETPVTTTPESSQQEAVSFLVDKFKSMVSDEVKSRVGLRMKDKVLDTVLKKFSQAIAYQPNLKDIKEAYKDPKIMYEAIKFAMDKEVLDKAEIAVMNDIVNKIVAEHNKNVKVVNSRGALDSKQKAVFLKWEDYKTPIKGVEDIKIKIDPINTFLKDNEDMKIHVIETPRIPAKKPFAMMGTKEGTYPLVMKPTIIRAIQDGKEVYIEPYGGVGTALYHLPDYFAQGLKEANINLFDVEKYTIVKAIKDKKMDVQNDVTEAYDTIVKEITDQLMMNEEFKKIYSETQMATLAESEVGSKTFREAIMLLGFHPQLAKEFFRQNIDAKVAIKGELTETFKSWVGKTMVEPEIKAEFPDLEGPDLEDAVKQGVDDLLSKPGLFEKQYAGMSESVKRILDKYDSDQYVSSIAGDYKKALLTAISRHFRQRGVSGQRVISPSDGFNSVEGVREKMIETLGQYDMTFKRYGNQINLFNQDGQKFINERSADLRNREMLEKSAWYFDPPYIKSNKMYLKNNPELRFALEKYSDYQGIKEIFRPALGENNTLLFTNDVDGQYFQSLKDLMGERMSKDIYAYKEGLTPTSFITTSDVGKGMKENQFMYYMLNKNAKIMKAVQFIDQLGGDIAQGLKKNIAKILSYVSPEMQKNLDKLEKIRTGMERAEVKYDDLVKAMDLVTTGREKQDLLRQAKAEAKQGFLTGKPLLKLIDTIQKNLVNLNTEQRALRKRLENFKKSESADAEIKKQFFDAFTKEYTEKQMTQAEQAQSPIKSIYSLNIDEVDALNKQLKEYTELARESRMKTEEQKAEEVNYQVEETKSLIEAGKAAPLESWTDKPENMPAKTWHAIVSFIDQYNTFADNMFERLGMGRLKRQVDSAMKKKDEFNALRRNQINDFYKKFDLKHEDDTKVNLYGLAKRGDGMGRVKLFALLTQVGDPLKLKYEPGMSAGAKIATWFKNRGESIANMIPRVHIVHPLTEEQALAKIEEYSQDSFLNAKQKKLYDTMRGHLDEVHPRASLVMLNESNQLVKYIEQFRPIGADQQLNHKNFALEQFKEQNYDMTETKYSLAKRQVEQTLNKQTTAKELVPIVSAYRNFSKYMTDVNYYSAVQPVINKARKVIDQLKENIGDRGFDYMTNKETGYLTDLARQGKTTLSPEEKFLENLQSKFAKSVLLFNPSSLLVQVTNVFDAAMSGFNRLRAGKTVQEYIRTNGRSAKQALERSTYLQNRMGHDKIKVMQDGIKDIFESKMDKIENFGGKLLNAIDMTTGITINETIYRQAIKEGKIHKEAQTIADMATKKAIGSFEHFDLPQSNRFFKGWKSPMRQFQTFVQNRYNLVRYDTLGERVKTSRMIQNLAYLVMAIAAEEIIREYVSKNVWGSKTKATPAGIIYRGLTSFLPTISTIAKTDMYGNIKIDPMNFSAFQSMGQGLTDLASTPKVIAKHKSLVKLLGSLVSDFGPLFGIPGGVPAGRLIGKMGSNKTSLRAF